MPVSNLCRQRQKCRSPVRSSYVYSPQAVGSLRVDETRGSRQCVFGAYGVTANDV